MNIDVYAIYNDINGKIYIGQTKRGYLKRFKEHLCKSSECRLLRRAIGKYGKEAFHAELLDIATNQEEANTLEKMWIKVLKTTNSQNGYNLCEGGVIGGFNEETLKRMSESHKGAKNYIYGKHHTLEARKKMSEIRKGMYLGEKHPQAKKVLCVETCVIYNCIKQAGEATGANRHHISQVCLKRKGRKTAGGYHWEYV